jgi:hypothetical protein
MELTREEDEMESGKLAEEILKRISLEEEEGPQYLAAVFCILGVNTRYAIVIRGPLTTLLAVH